MNEKSVVRVRDVMKTKFDVVDGMITVKDALDRMKHVDTKTLIVDKRHDNDEYGIVLIADIARFVLAVDRSPDRVNIYEIMSKPVVTVHSTMDIRYCARLFDKFGLSRAPVVEDSKLVGIVSYTDMVIRGMMNNLEARY
jgi:CBS domain-containing protein